MIKLKRNEIFEYIRDKKNNTKIGVMYAYKSNHTKKIFIGYSLYNQKKEKIPFIREYGLAIAKNRAKYNKHFNDSSDNFSNLTFSNISTNTRNALLNFSHRCSRYFISNLDDCIINTIDS